AAGAGLDVLDAVVGNQRTVVAHFRAQDLNAVVVGTYDGVARSDQALSVERGDRRSRGVGDDVIGNFARDLLEPDAVAAAAHDLAIAEADGAPGQAVDQAAAGGERHSAAVERDAVKTNVIGAFAQEQRGTASKDKPGRTAHADKLRAALKAQRAAAV